MVYLISDPNQQSKNLDQIFFNLKNSLFNDKKIREALNQLFDRKTSCPKIYGPFEISLPQSSGHALATFKNAGWTDSDKDGVLDKTIDGKRQPFEFEIMYDKPESEAILTTLKEVFKSFGIRITLKNTDSAIFWKVLNDKKFQAYFNSQDLNETVLGSEWRSTGYYNNQSFNNPRVDKALDQLDITFDAQKRQNLIDTIRVNISAEFPSLVLCQTNREKFAIKASHPKDLIKKGIPLWGWFEK